MSLQPFDPQNPDHITNIASIWNTACGADLAITPRFVEFNTRPSAGGVQAGQLAIREGQPVGFVLASALPSDPDTSPPQMGWIDAVAVLGNYRQRSIGSRLLAWAEEWLRAQGCTRFRLGGSLRPFAPGYPVELGKVAYFEKRGYAARAGSGETWDVARDLNEYQRTTAALPGQVSIRPACPGEENALLQFLQREFPGRWRYEYQESLRQHGRISDYVLLWTERGVDGFAHLTFEDSFYPMDRCYMHRLPRPWGQLGPIGVSERMRGKGYGSALLDAGLWHLRERGVRGCVIDWTGLVGFYARFGFAPYRRYAMLIKDQ